MEENKKKKSSGMWMFLLIFAVIIGLFVYIEYFYNPNTPTKNQEQVKSDIPIGTIYEYSDKEIEGFISEAEKQLEIDKRYGLEPGYDINTWNKYKDGKFNQIWYSEEYIKEHNVKIYDNYYVTKELDGTCYSSALGFVEKLPSQVKYKVNKLKATDAFNDDLSLKIADAFYGYASVGEPYLPIVLNDKIYDKKDAKSFFPGARQNLERFMSEIEALDKKYKNDGEALLKKLNSLVLNQNDNLNGRIGGVQLFKDLYRNYTSTNSMNALQTFLASKYEIIYRPEGYWKLVEDLNINYGKEKKLDYYPDEYNYFNDHNNYFFYYYPTRVEKIDERRYLVDIETSDIPTKYATELIYYQIITNFNTKYRNLFDDAIDYESYKEKMDIIVRINNNKMNKGMLLDNSMGSVLYPEVNVGTDSNGYPQNITDVGLRILVSHPRENYITWYPNEKAQELLEHYFTYAKEAFDTDSYFSIVETIEKSANEVEMDISDAKSILYSYYLYCSLCIGDIDF